MQNKLAVPSDTGNLAARAAELRERVARMRIRHGRGVHVNLYDLAVIEAGIAEIADQLEREVRS